MPKQTTETQQPIWARAAKSKSKSRDEWRVQTIAKEPTAGLGDGTANQPPGQYATWWHTNCSHTQWHGAAAKRPESAEALFQPWVRWLYVQLSGAFLIKSVLINYSGRPATEIDLTRTRAKTIRIDHQCDRGQRPINFSSFFSKSFFVAICLLTVHLRICRHFTRGNSHLSSSQMIDYALAVFWIPSI